MLQFILWVYPWVWCVFKNLWPFGFIVLSYLCSRDNHGRRSQSNFTFYVFWGPVEQRSQILPAYKRFICLATPPLFWPLVTMAPNFSIGSRATLPLRWKRCHHFLILMIALQISFVFEYSRDWNKQAGIWHCRLWILHLQLWRRWHRQRWGVKGSIGASQRIGK